MDAFDASPLRPAPAELQLHEIRFAEGELIVAASARRRVVACPGCQCPSTRLHSRYRRTLADLPWHGLGVRVEVEVRRFFCDQPGCARRIFTERLPKTACPYARRTSRAMTTPEIIAVALGGRAGARLARELGLLISASALVARVRARPAAVIAAATRESGMTPRPAGSSVASPRVLGVDDWAWRQGQRYGTILVDLERHRVIDLLPDREQPTLVAWLKAHPGIEIITRDCASAYAEAAREGAPEAIQIPDRFHLVRNLMEAMEGACRKHHTELKVASDVTHPKPPPVARTRKRRYSELPNNRPGPTKHEQRTIARRARRVAPYEEVVALRTKGLCKRRISKIVGSIVARWRRGSPRASSPSARRNAGARIISISTRPISSNGLTGVSTTGRRSRVSCARVAIAGMMRKSGDISLTCNACAQGRPLRDLTQTRHGTPRARRRSAGRESSPAL